MVLSCSLLVVYSQDYRFVVLSGSLLVVCSQDYRFVVLSCSLLVVVASIVGTWMDLMNVIVKMDYCCQVTTQRALVIN